MSKISCNSTKDLLPLYIDGVVSDATAAEIRQHLQGCEKCLKEFKTMTADLPLPVNEEVQIESAKPLKALKKKFIIISLCLIALAALISIAAANLFTPAQEVPDDIKWANEGLVISELSPGDEAVSSFEIILEENNSSIYYTGSWSRMSLTLEYGLRASDGTEYSFEKNGGNDFGKFEGLPAGTYRMFARNSGDYTSYPSYQNPDKFPDVSFDITGVILYSID